MQLINVLLAPKPKPSLNFSNEKENFYSFIIIIII